MSEPARVGAGVDGVRTPDELVLLMPQAMRARRHPRALAGLWAWETALALMVSGPTAALAGAAWHGDAHGDGPLWAPGGHALLDWLWHDFHGLRAAMAGAEMALAVGAVVGLVPMAAAMTTLAYATRERRAAGLLPSLTAGLRVFPAMALLLVLAGLLQILVVGAGAVLASAIEGWTHLRLGEARAEQIEGVIVLVFVAVASGLGVMHDLARAAVVRFRVTGFRGLALGARTLRLSPISLWWSWAWRALASLAPVIAVGLLAGKIGGRGGLELALLLVLHQAVVAVRVALRTSWLARALRGVDGALVRVR